MRVVARALDAGRPRFAAWLRARLPRRFRAEETGLIPLPRIPPLHQFLALSALVLLATGAAEAWALGREIESQIVTQTAQSVAEEARRDTRQQVTAADLERPFTGERYQAFADFLRSRVLSDRVHRVKLWNARGQIVYSDDPAVVGRTFDNAEVARVVRDGVIVMELDRIESENVGEQRYGRLVEIYVPLVPRDSERVLGAYEVYLNYEPIAAQVGRAQRAIWVATVGALAALWLGLFGIFLAASRAVRRAEAERQRAAYRDEQVRRDPLTGLANRVFLEERLAGELSTASTEHPVAVLLADLDNLKEINDQLGHEVGDALLRQVAARFLGEVRRIDSVARVGGDEFVVLLPGADIAGATAVAQKLLRALAGPFTIEGVEVTSGASIGVAVSTEAQDAAALLRRADAASYVAQRLGGDTYALYEPRGDAAADEPIRLASELREAITTGELRLEYQPIVRLATGELVGVEALVRWQHPRLGMLLPAEFVPLAERAGLIRALTAWVVGAVSRDMERLRFGSVSVCVNISLRDVFDADLRSRVAALCAREGHRLTLELSERSVVTLERRLLDALGRLRAAGARLAIDDFGAGTWSLAHLRSLPVDVLKIDGSLTGQITTQPEVKALVQAIVGIARSRGQDVVGLASLSWTPEHLGPKCPRRRSTCQGHDPRTPRSSAPTPSVCCARRARPPWRCRASWASRPTRCASGRSELTSMPAGAPTA